MQYWKICKTLWKIFSSQYFLKYYHICIFTYVWGTSVTLNFLGVEDRTLYTGSNFSFAVGGVNQMWTTFPQIKRNTKVEEEKSEITRRKRKYHTTSVSIHYMYGLPSFAFSKRQGAYCTVHPCYRKPQAYTVNSWYAGYFQSHSFKPGQALLLGNLNNFRILHLLYLTCYEELHIEKKKDHTVPVCKDTV